MSVTNFGQFGEDYEDRRGAEWPQGSGEGYIFCAGFWFGCIRNGDTLVSRHIWDFNLVADFCPGPPEHAQDHLSDPNSHPEDRVYLSSNAQDTAEWPRDRRDASGRPIVVSDQDAWCEFNDLVEVFRYPEQTPSIGLDVRQLSCVWTDTLRRDMVLLRYAFKNISDRKLEDAYVGLGVDADVGYSNNDFLGFDYGRGLCWTSTLVRESTWTSAPPYYIGILVTRGPIADNPVGVPPPRDDPGYPYTSKDTIPVGTPVPLTSFVGLTFDKPPMTLPEQYLTLAGYALGPTRYDPWINTSQMVPRDWVMVLACGPFDLAAGEEDSFTVAVMFSNGDVGGLDYLKRQADYLRGTLGLADEPDRGVAALSLECSPCVFVDRVSIRFVLPLSSQVRMTVHDGTGRTIWESRDMRLPAGIHQSIWDGRDAGGREVGPGVYFLRLVSEAQTASVKVIKLE